MDGNRGVDRCGATGQLGRRILEQRLLGVRLPWAFALATVLGALAGVAGYLFAFFYQFSVGGSQTVMAALFAILAIVLQLVRGRPIRLALAVSTRTVSPPP